MLLNKSLRPPHDRRKIVNNNFNHILRVIPKHMVEQHEKKIKQEPKYNVSTPNHVLFEFSKKHNVLESKPEPILKPTLEKDNMVEYVVDDYIDMGNIYDSDFEKSEYNPMYFSLRHYISSK